MESDYQLIRSRKRKKTLSLKITEKGTVVIQAPYHTPAGEVAAFFERKKAWVQEKIRLLQQYPSALSSDSPATGKRLLFLGVSYPLVVEEHGSHLELFRFRDQQFILNGRVRNHGKTLIRTWYEQQAGGYLPGRIHHFSCVWDLRPEAVRISNAQSRWGSCSPKDVLAFTWRLMMAPPDVIDYVIVHELAHIREKNHARSFWSLVARMMPDYETHRRWLRQNAHQLHI